MNARLAGLLLVTALLAGCGDGVSSHNENLSKIDAKTGPGAKAAGPTANAAKPSQP